MLNHRSQRRTAARRGRSRSRGALRCLSLALLACWADAPVLAAPATPAGPAGLFDRTDALPLEVHMDAKRLCRDPRRASCADLPAALVYSDDEGVERRLDVSLRSRGRFRDETGDCSLPALFVFFGDDTTGTPFAGETMLPLTTHCRTPAHYEQYVLKEYLAYRIYNTLTDKSLRVRLLRVTYHDTSERTEPLTRYAFFVEHFDSLGARHEAVPWRPERFDVLGADALEIATLDLFQYLIGNTDWSAVFSHNVVLIRDAVSRVTPVPYDFDFSGLVDAHYATVDPQLAIRDVKQRVFRGVCRPDTDWPHVFAAFQARRGAIEKLLDKLDVTSSDRDEARRYVDSFFATLSSEPQREREIVAACRSPKVGG
jgi:hypothetical protein